MSRAVSTVVDASMAVLLVSAAALALATVPGGTSQPPDPDAAARTVLASTATTTYGPGDGSVASGRVATLAAHAAVAADRGTDSGFVRGVETATEDVLAETGGRIEVLASAGGTTVRAGPRPPADASVASVSHEVGVRNTTATVTVRTWSP
ncbi:DUF7284 family protein [Halobacterium litoreum]|uniref:Uncharacterized protein n=1 Tax=Halobacterium litoreum TaxID=2039234 RepID=A0ABD5NGP1_9EURY|nr:hypothetical protein [Halobacterium litoreum]UHH12770.1 hypothetical protein LT972_11440 [Halobacterium litoreum]